MKYILLILLLAGCSQVDKKVDKFYWDPLKGMIRITFGQIK